MTDVLQVEETKDIFNIHAEYHVCLESRQYKNDVIAYRNIFILNLRAFSLTMQASEKARQFQNKQFS